MIIIRMIVVMVYRNVILCHRNAVSLYQCILVMIRMVYLYYNGDSI